MSLDLDRRQRAMLHEMGLRVWSPEAAADAPRQLPATTSSQTVPVLQSQAAPAVTAPALQALMREPPPGAMAEVGVLAENIASMAWPTLTQSVATCQACQLCNGRRAPVFGATDTPHQADWLVVGEPPDEVEERAGEPFAEQAGQLLDNMLKAVKVSRHGCTSARSAAAYVTNVVKCRPAALRNPTSQELATCEHYLRREVALVQPRIILALGRFAAYTLLQGGVPEGASIPLGQLRGQIHHYQGIPVLVTYPPNYLLRSPQHKARAWADLCQAMALLRRES
jgi:DNA polymerase